MKQIFILLSTIITAATACQKVINVDINDSDKKIVIEGSVSTNVNLGSQVVVSRSKNFSNNNSLDYVSGAIVTIQENNGVADTLKESSQGIYTNKNIVGKLNSTYHLVVNVGDKTFTSTSVMQPKVVTLDTLTVESFVFGGTVNKTVRPAYLDPIGVVNFYKFIQYKNEKQVKRVFAFDDNITDGKVVTRPFINPDGDLKTGDTVRMEMMCVDKNVYQFWYSLEQFADGQGNSATPTNPVSNINGGALGVFSAETYNTRTIIIP